MFNEARVAQIATEDGEFLSAELARLQAAIGGAPYNSELRPPGSGEVAERPSADPHAGIGA